MNKVGFIGWRGMVGSVLLNRMKEEGDLEGLNATFYSTSNAGGSGPEGSTLEDAFSIESLVEKDILVSTQGSDYTNEVYPKLQAAGWNGYWIDASSTLRMDDNAVIILDPANREVINRELDSGKKIFIGGNCTVSLMIMALAGLFRENLIEWVHSSTYQAASGAGARQMTELVEQMQLLGSIFTKHPSASALELERLITEEQNKSTFPVDALGGVLAGSLIPWIDKAMEEGQSREEWKGQAETNKILGLNNSIIVDGVCVRIGALRCHSQSLLIKLRKDVSLTELEDLIASGTSWTKLIENTPEATKKGLHPAAVSGTLDVPIGRVRKMKMGQDFLGAFTVGDQLLWGAAEPLRRMLRILVD